MARTADVDAVLRSSGDFGHSKWGGCEISGLVNTCVVRKDGEVSELLCADLGEGQVTGLPEGAEACSALGGCQVVGEDGSIVVDDVPVRVFSRPVMSWRSALSSDLGQSGWSRSRGFVLGSLYASRAGT